MSEQYADLHTGSSTATVYWVAPETGAALDHTDVGDEGTVPFQLGQVAVVQCDQGLLVVVVSVRQLP